MKTERIIITGARGMLGRQFVQNCIARGIDHFACDVDEVDITDATEIDTLLGKTSPTIVINCAGFTNVDAAESERDTAHRVNAEAPGLLARACRSHDALLVHYSTDYVFNGCSDQPISVDENPDPINEYGRSKLAGERAVAEDGCEYLIVRTSWLYATHGSNFVRTMLRLGAERDSLDVVDDQRGRPTLSIDLADATFDLLNAGARGITHVANSGECTWCEFATAVMQLAGLGCTINPCASSAHPRPAARPSYGVLDLHLTQQLIGPLRPWRDALADCLTTMGYEAAHLKAECGTGVQKERSDT